MVGKQELEFMSYHYSQIVALLLMIGSVWFGSAGYSCVPSEETFSTKMIGTLSRVENYQVTIVILGALE